MLLFSQSFMAALYTKYNNRFNLVLTLIDELLFHKLDFRLSVFLLRKYEMGSPLKITHQEIADELGSRREVISRILKDLESRGIVKLSRGSILITNVSKISKIAALM